MLLRLVLRVCMRQPDEAISRPNTGSRPACALCVVHVRVSQTVYENVSTSRGSQYLLLSKYLL